MNLLIEHLTMPDGIRERERLMRRDDLLAAAHRARCDERGCHPFLERMSRILIAAGAWLNTWAAPSHRRVPVRSRPEPAAASVR